MVKMQRIGQSAGKLLKIEYLLKILYIMDWLVNKQRINIPNIGKLGKLSKKDLERILSKINYSNLDFYTCWIWIGTVQDKNGKGHQHGIIWYNKNYVQTHRIMYHNFIDDVPEYNPGGIVVLHKCSHENNGRCINPWHLKLGTSKENTKDALNENTLCLYKNNEENPNSKLSNEQIDEIRKLKNSNLSQKKIALIYNINQSQISRYFNNKTRIKIKGDSSETK
jgi:DNA-binding transcriptional regulator YiaG